MTTASEERRSVSIRGIASPTMTIRGLASDPQWRVGRASTLEEVVVGKATYDRTIYEEPVGKTAGQTACIGHVATVDAGKSASLNHALRS